MTLFPFPAPPPIREPDAPTGLHDPALVALYDEAKGRYRARQYAEALQVYERLAALVPSDTRVKLLIGFMHLWGTGTPRQPEKAEQWLERAGREGNDYAYLSLAKICRDTSRSEKARQWLREAADRGYGPAMYSLGHGWEFGYWGTVDRTRALEWYERAAAKGYCQADWRIGAMLLKGGRGLWWIPVGLVRYLAAAPRMARLLWRDPYDERIIW